MLTQAIAAVQEFHVAKNIDFKEPLKSEVLSYDNELLCLIVTAKSVSEKALAIHKSGDEPDLRHLRIHLCLEESTVELLKALRIGSRLALLDALADASVVQLGTAIAFDIPLAEGFTEVCRSNMTKQPFTPGSCSRLRDKGSAYEPPRLQEILEAHRS